MSDWLPTKAQGTYAYAAVRVMSPAELRSLFRLNPARAQRHFVQLNTEAKRARNADLAAIKREARDKAHQRQLADEYRDACLIPQNRAVDKLRRLYARLLESASDSELARVEPEFRRSSSWDMAMAIGPAAAVVTAPRLRHPLPRRTPAARPAARRPGTRRTTRTSRGSPSGDDSDGEPARLEPWREGKPRHVRFALAEVVGGLAHPDAEGLARKLEEAPA